MIKKKYPANTSEMKNKLFQQAKSRIVTHKKNNHCASSSITVVEFFQTKYTLSYRLRFLGSVFLSLRGDVKETSGRLRDFCVS